MDSDISEIAKFKKFYKILIKIDFYGFKYLCNIKILRYYIKILEI